MSSQQGSAGNVLAAICSFIIPGLGQMTQGRVGIGIIFFIMTFLLWFILLGWVMNFVAMIEAATFKGEITQ